MEKPRVDRTPKSDFLLALELFNTYDDLIRDPERWSITMLQNGRVSPEEIQATVEAVLRLAPYMPEAREAVGKRLHMYFESEYDKYSSGPLLGIKRKMVLPKHIGSREEIAEFFAYLLLEDHTSIDPDVDFSEMVSGRDNVPAYTPAEAKARNILMIEAIQAAEANDLDIYEMGLWVGALTMRDDPENRESAPAWLKELAKEWF